MAKRRRVKPKSRAQVTPHVAFAPAAAVMVTPASFDDFIPDRRSIKKPATTPEMRRKARYYCEEQWVSLDISAINRVEGAEPGWGMTRY